MTNIIVKGNNVINKAVRIRRIISVVVTLLLLVVLIGFSFLIFRAEKFHCKLWDKELTNNSNIQIKEYTDNVFYLSCTYSFIDNSINKTKDIIGSNFTYKIIPNKNITNDFSYTVSKDGYTDTYKFSEIDDIIFNDYFELRSYNWHSFLLRTNGDINYILSAFNDYKEITILDDVDFSKDYYFTLVITAISEKNKVHVFNVNFTIV